MADYDLDYFKDNKKTTPRHAASKGKRYANSSKSRASSSKKGTAAEASKKRRTYNQSEPVHKAPRRATPATGKVSSNRKPPVPKQSHKVRNVLIAVIAVAVVAVIAVTTGITMINLDRENRKKQPFRFSQGVSVSGIDISGLSYDDALNKITVNQMSVVKNIKIDVTANDYNKTLKKTDFSYLFDYEGALKEAKVYSLKEQDIYEPKKGEKETRFIKLDNPDFKLDYEVDVTSIETVAGKIAEKVDLEPVNARVSKFRPFASSRFSYKDGKVGYELDKEDLQNQITYFFNEGGKKTSIEAVVNTIEPDISLDDVKKNIVGLSTATSVSTNNANGNHNMKTALEACNGSVIEPGEVWSFNQCTGDSNLESKGYKKADVISNKKVEQGVGGGICQASTTIFNSAVFANMAVIERHNHYWASVYAFAGEDATIDYPNLDLRLKNTTDYQMFMECKMEGTTLTVNIFGYQDPSYDNVKLKSENYDIQKKKSYKTTTTRYLYLDGEIVKEEVICNSTYSLKDDHSMRPDDKGSFRKTVNGVIKYEAEPTTAPPEENEETVPETVPE